MDRRAHAHPFWKLPPEVTHIYFHLIGQTKSRDGEGQAALPGE